MAEEYEYSTEGLAEKAEMEDYVNQYEAFIIGKNVGFGEYEQELDSAYMRGYHDAYRELDEIFQKLETSIADYRRWKEIFQKLETGIADYRRWKGATHNEDRKTP